MVSAARYSGNCIWKFGSLSRPKHTTRFSSEEEEEEEQEQEK